MRLPRYLASYEKSYFLKQGYSQGRPSFFEKKKQKTFVCCRGAANGVVWEGELYSDLPGAF